MSDFDTYFDQEIAPRLPEMEQKRKRLASLGKRRLKVINIFATIIAGLLAIYGWIQFGSFWVFFGTVFSVFIGMVLFQDQLKDWLLRNDGIGVFRKEYKQHVIAPIVRFFNPDWSYEPSGRLSRDQLMESHLFDIRRNTKVETDDVIQGAWHGRQLLIANVKTTSTKETDTARMRNASNQSFNGLFVRMALEMEGQAFLVPKAKTAAGVGGLAGMKFSRDPDMTLQEQRAFNMKALSEGVGGYSWHAGLTDFKDSLKSHKLEGPENKEYLFYTSNDTLWDQLKSNEKLGALMSKSFASNDTANKLAQNGSLKLLDNHLMDRLVQTTLTYAIHSGYIWVLIPAFEDKFELSLSLELSKETVMRIYNDLALAQASLLPFINN